MIVYSLLEKKQKFIKIVKEQGKCKSVPMCSIISVITKYCTVHNLTVKFDKNSLR